MGEYHIRGGRRLRGELRVRGGKNAVLPMFAAMILNGAECVLHNCPRIRDTFISAEILRCLGCKVTIEGNTVVVNSSGARDWHIPEELSGEMRSSVIFMGGLLGRFGQADISYPGGCELGTRPIDMHIKALAAMGTFIETGERLLCQTKGLTGARIPLQFPSVGATENIMLAAVLAKGQTKICNAAREPEIVDLQGFLNGMGADIKGAGTDTIVINGVEKLHSVEYCAMPDRIVAGTYLAAAAITGGELWLTGVTPSDLIPVTSAFTEMGCRIAEVENTITLKAPGRLHRIPHLATHPHPGFPTDMQAPLTATLSLAEGTSVVKENLFSSRNGHIIGLQRMGADILEMQDNRSFVIRGVENLQGATVEATDLRCGAALILAGLAAEGNTVVKESIYVERGYEQIELALQKVGAEISFK